MRIAGRTAVVCASTSGLGEGVARALGAEGANVVVTGRRAERAKEIAADLPSAIGLGIDLLSPGAPERIVEAAADAFGPVDILVLNGPGPKPGTALDVSTEDIDSAVASLAAFDATAEWSAACEPLPAQQVEIRLVVELGGQRGTTVGRQRPCGHPAGFVGARQARDVQRVAALVDAARVGGQHVPAAGATRGDDDLDAVCGGAVAGWTV